MTCDGKPLNGLAVKVAIVTPTALALGVVVANTEHASFVGCRFLLAVMDVVTVSVGHDTLCTSARNGKGRMKKRRGQSSCSTISLTCEKGGQAKLPRAGAAHVPFA